MINIIRFAIWWINEGACESCTDVLIGVGDKSTEAHANPQPLQLCVPYSQIRM